MVSCSALSTQPRYQWCFGTAGYNNEIDYLIDGLLPSKSFGVIYGPSGSFKSFLVMGLAAHISTGTDWDERRVRQAGVLYVVAEGGIGAPRRVKAWEKAKNEGKSLENFFVVNEPIHIANFASLNMMIETINHIEHTQKTKIELIIFDTLARCFNGADENSTKDMNLFVSGCDILKARTGATVLVVHHSGKNENNAARGSSALRAACDFEYKVTKGVNESDDPNLILSCEKMKDDEPPSKRQFYLESQFVFQDQNGNAKVSLVVNEKGRPFDGTESSNTSTGVTSKLQVAIWDIIRSRISKGEPTSRSVIRDDFKALGHPSKNFSRALIGLVDKGKVIIDGENLSCRSE
ncbi:helicase RepA family protein [Vibrio sp.]|nr:helicase RepA family protein [Vibrio sp.]